jgi:hypothetical protein
VSEFKASRETAARQTAAENKAGSAASSSNTTHSQQKAQQRKAMETNTRLGITLQVFFLKYFKIFGLYSRKQFKFWM